MKGRPGTWSVVVVAGLTAGLVVGCATAQQEAKTPDQLVEERQQLMTSLAVTERQHAPDPSRRRAVAADDEGPLRVLVVTRPSLAGEELDVIAEIGEPGRDLGATHGKVTVGPVRELLDDEHAALTVRHRRHRNELATERR